MTELVREHDAGVKDGVAVVLIHGWEGDGHRSWTSGQAGSQEPWSRWLGREAGCDTWTLGYDCKLSTWRDFAGALHINGLSLMDKLATEPQLAGRPLILLAHDIGGLLVKKALTHAMTKAAPRHRRMVGRIAAVGLIATPQSGAQLNTIAQAISLTHQLAPIDKDFAVDDVHIQELRREFSQLGDGLQAKVVVYAESKPVIIGRKWLGLLKTRKIAVPYDAQIPHIASEVAITLAEDHFSICRPNGQSAPLHQSVTALIESGKRFVVAASESTPQASVAMPTPSVAPAQPVSEPVAVVVAPAPQAPQQQVTEATVVVEKPVIAPLPQIASKAITVRPALITGAQDERLQLSESKLYGRDRELTRVLTFLDNADECAAAVLSQGLDVGGTGKSELCKAALKLWMQRDAQRKVFFIDLIEDGGLAAFLQALATGIGLGGGDNVDTLFAEIPAGLYYLDNLSGSVWDGQGQQLMERLKNLPGVRLLISSRQATPEGFAQRIEIDALPKQSALNLFRDLWGGSDVLPVDTMLAQFVDNDLQRHAMSTVLLARLGVFYGYDEMRARWQAQRVENPSEHGVQTSLRLVKQALSAKTGALAMWRMVAQTPQGVDAAQLLQSEADGLHPRGTAEFLQHHRIIHRSGKCFVTSTVVSQAGLVVEAEVAAG